MLQPYGSVQLKRRRFRNSGHPYRALSELGKALKTTFLCEYLSSEKIRGEIQTNRLEDQEIAVLALHLLQNCLVLINTLMIQEVLLDKNESLL